MTARTVLDGKELFYDEKKKAWLRSDTKEEVVLDPYIVVKAPHSEDLAPLVCEYISLGYECSGGVAVVPALAGRPRVCYQAMIKVDQDSKRKK